ncbi:MAG: filamentation induced by cAMP protein fic, partial [Marinobacter sp. T13-3]
KSVTIKRNERSRSPGTGGHVQTEWAVTMGRNMHKGGQFQLTAQCACDLHRVAAKEEVLEWGCFCSGSVLIAGTDYEPPESAKLSGLFDGMVRQARGLDDVYDQAIHLFLTMARCQFFYDVNKRLGRFMMNGHLLNHGYPAINIPASRQLEFNELMLAFYESGDQDEMNRFVRSCMDERVVRIMNESPTS